MKKFVTLVMIAAATTFTMTSCGGGDEAATALENFAEEMEAATEEMEHATEEAVEEVEEALEEPLIDTTEMETPVEEVEAAPVEE